MTRNRQLGRLLEHFRHRKRPRAPTSDCATRAPQIQCRLAPAEQARLTNHSQSQMKARLQCWAGDQPPQDPECLRRQLQGREERWASPKVVLSRLPPSLVNENRKTQATGRTDRGTAHFIRLYRSALRASACRRLFDDRTNDDASIDLWTCRQTLIRHAPVCGAPIPPGEH